MAKAIKRSPAKKKTQNSIAKVEAVKDEPIILVTNDDGITAPGIHNLVEAVKDLGKVVVVAPDKPQSGMGHIGSGPGQGRIDPARVPQRRRQMAAGCRARQDRPALSPHAGRRRGCALRVTPRPWRVRRRSDRRPSDEPPGGGYARCLPQRP